MPNPPFAVLADYRIVFLTLHVLSMAIGLGGATVADILFFKFLKDYHISKKEEEVLHLLKSVILTIMAVIAVTGVALYLPEAGRFNDSPMFLVKMLATGVLIVNGVALHVFVAPYLIRLDLRRDNSMGRGWHRLAFALGAISITSWYSVFLIAMLKRELPFTFPQMLGIYLGLLITAIAGSQVMEMFLRKKARG